MAPPFSGYLHWTDPARNSYCPYTLRTVVWRLAKTPAGVAVVAVQDFSHTTQTCSSTDSESMSTRSGAPHGRCQTVSELSANLPPRLPLLSRHLYHCSRSDLGTPATMRPSPCHLLSHRLSSLWGNAHHSVPLSYDYRVSFGEFPSPTKAPDHRDLLYPHHRPLPHRARRL